MRACTLIIVLLGLLTLFPGRLLGQSRALTPEEATGVRITAVRTLGTNLEAPRRLERRLGLEVGKVFDAADTERSRRQLLRAGWLRKLDVLPLTTAAQSLLVVVVAEPAPRAQVTPILQMRADDRLVYGGALQVWGRGGRGERLSLSVAGGGEKLLSLEWNEPRPFLSVPLAARFRAGVSREAEAAEESVRFERSVVVARLAIPEQGVRLELTGSLSHVRSSDPAASLGADGEDRMQHGSVALAIGEAPRTFAWSSFHARAGVGATRGDAQAQDLELQLGGTTHVGNRFVLASGLTWRSVRGVIPRSSRVHLGSGASLRGHAYGVANGDAGTWGGMEVRVPINFWSRGSFARVQLPVAFTLFADAGTAWGASAPGARTEAPRLEDARLRWSSGCGVVAFVHRTHPFLMEVGRDDVGTWRLEFRTELAF